MVDYRDDILDFGREGRSLFGKRGFIDGRWRVLMDPGQHLLKLGVLLVLRYALCMSGL